MGWRDNIHSGECCDGPGGEKTYANQVLLPLDGRVRAIDLCIHELVAARSAGGITTTASCCGHGKVPGIISLKDGRHLVIVHKVPKAIDGKSMAYPWPDDQKR